MNTARKKVRPSFKNLFIYFAGRYASRLSLMKYKFHTDVLPRYNFNYLVVSNHLTELDWFMLINAFPRHMFFLAGEHMTRSKVGRALLWAQDPILKVKGDRGVESVKSIVRYLKDGNNIALFPEGSRSFNGETLKVSNSIGKLVKMAKRGLVTYRIHGGYFVAPRWAYTTRTGPMSGKIVNVYTPEQLEGMSDDEITDIVNRDLYENAYSSQRKDRFIYEGERLAEGMENYLVMCPKCRSIDSLETRDDTFTCKCCGLTGRYTPDGFLEGENLKFDSVEDWGKWSEDALCEYIRNYEGDGPIFTDDVLSFSETTKDHEAIDLGTGKLEGYRDRIEICGHTFKFDSMPAMEMLYYGKTLLFTSQHRHFAITGEAFHAIKYCKLFDVNQGT